MKSQTNLPELEILFVSSSHNLAENCYNCLKSGKLAEEFRIIPRYCVLTEKKCKPEDIRDNMLVVLHADSKEDIEKIKPEWQNFTKVQHRVFCSEKEDSRNWLSVLNDSGLKAFVGKKDENITAFRDYIRNTGLVSGQQAQTGPGVTGTKEVKQQF